MQKFLHFIHQPHNHTFARQCYSVIVVTTPTQPDST